ncbi:MAG TPA: serine/threonine-protein kinase [Kofleriaceae bacterium]|jgi:serine/threonine protein kinase|nr:serine/threonine-protein kinase [Kofleriaceae bacterium]
MVHAGDAPIDRYVVLEHLSEGGMGAIYVGKKMGAGGFEMEVVLKQLLPEFTQQEEFIDLFLREAKLSATLDHANIVHTIDLVTAGGEYFIVMEYLPGGDLRTLLKKAKRRGKRFSPAAAIYICREIASALSYAHSKRDFDGQPLKLIHRDVSPSNVLLSYQGEVKLTDFGIAKAATHTSLFYKVKGKIGYMSPEQAKSESLDHRSDLYSLAVCFYEILTGERLFVHAGLTTSADEIYSQPVPQVSRKVAGLPPDLDGIMAKALAIDPDKRYQTAGELQEALMRCAHRNGLLMSAPELAKELREACGPTETWRGDEDDEDPSEMPRAGTEVYDAVDDDDDELDVGPMSVHSLAARANKNAARSSQAHIAAKSPPLNVKSPPPGLPPLRRKTEVGKFEGVELTSIINMMDLDDQGSKPLVDLDSGPRQMPPSPQPRQRIDSDPSLSQFVNSLPGPGAAPSPMTQTMQGMPPPMQPPRASGVAPIPNTMGGFGAVPAPQVPQPFDQSDIQATLPRNFPAANVGERTDRGLAMPRRPKPKPLVQPWMVIAAIVLVAIIIALVVAMSGPDVPAK